MNPLMNELNVNSQLIFEHVIQKIASSTFSQASADHCCHHHHAGELSSSIEINK